MIPVVIDASAGVELIADTARGRALRRLLPADTVPWTPETFYVEVGSVLRRWELHTILTAEQTAEAVRQLHAWPLRVVQVRSLFSAAWRYRHNITFADATYIALAEHLNAPLLTDDHKLAGAPTLPVRTLRLPVSP